METPGADTREMACARCGDVARVPLVGAGCIYLGSPVTARASGLGCFCAACKAAFCSRHASWGGPDIPDLPALPEGPVQILMAHCPGCGAMAGGLNAAP